MRYAALLHDFGKVAVQERYLRKGKKLYASQMIAMRQRFAYILRSIEADYLRERLAALESGDASAERLALIEAEYHRRRADAERVRDIVQKANEPTVVEAERVRALSSVPTRSFPMLDKDPDVEDQDPFPVEEWAERPLAEHQGGRAALDHQGQSVGERAQEDRRARHRDLQVPAEAAVDRRAGARPRDRLCASREAQRHRATRASSRPRRSRASRR